MVENHENNGRFSKGNTVAKTAAKQGRITGRPKTIKGQVKDALKIAEDAMPMIIKSMVARATGEEECPKNVQQAAAEYLIERVYGKVAQPVTGEIGIHRDAKEYTDAELISIIEGRRGGGNAKTESGTPGPA